MAKKKGNKIRPIASVSNEVLEWKRSGLSVVEMRMWVAILSYVWNTEKSHIEMSIDDFRDLANIPQNIYGKRLTEFVINTAMKIQAMTVGYYKTPEGEYGAAWFFTETFKITPNNILVMDINEKYMQLLKSARGNYTKFAIDDFKVLSHKMSQYLFLRINRERFRLYNSGVYEKLYISKADLEDELDAHNYSSHDFNVRIIRPAIKELNDRNSLDLDIGYEIVKVGKKLVGYNFIIGNPKSNTESIEENEWDTPF